MEVFALSNSWPDMNAIGKCSSLHKNQFNSIYIGIICMYVHVYPYVCTCVRVRIYVCMCKVKIWTYV